jgi:glycosyltransferase involved in cell wall biosynthesis
VLVTPDADGPERFPRRPARSGEPARTGAHPERVAAARERAARLEAGGVRLLTSPPHPLHFRLDGRGVRAAVAACLAVPARDGGPTALMGYWHEAWFLPSLARARGAVFTMAGAASYSQFFGPGHGALARLRNARLAATYRAARIVFARSEFTAGELRRYLDLPAERLRVVPLGVDPRFLELERAPAGAVRELVYVGQLTASKGIFDALEALAIMDRGRGEPRPARLRVVGHGDPGPVRTRARELGLEDRIALVGGLDRAGVAAELARAQLALLPSHTESFGLAVAEAQAAGRAGVGFAAGAVPEVVVDGETGWLVETGRADLLAGALAAALDDPLRTPRAGQAGRERVRARFSWRRAAERTRAGQEEALQEPGTGAAEAAPGR